MFVLLSCDFDSDRCDRWIVSNIFAFLKAKTSHCLRQQLYCMGEWGMGNGERKIVSDNNYNVWECIVIEYLARMEN